MTILDEITTSRKLNRKFWNAHVRFYIAMRRENLRLQRPDETYLKCIQSALKDRKNYEYLGVQA